jgi:hypothetical protein
VKGTFLSIDLQSKREIIKITKVQLREESVAPFNCEIIKD